MQYKRFTLRDTYLARLETGADWREQIETLAAETEVEAGWFNAMGAVQDAEIWFYDQTDNAYQPKSFDEPLEVAACVGNIALLDGDVFAHTHAVLSRPDGSTVAGHLDSATVFAGEVYLQAFEDSLVRDHDEWTGLDLWL